MTKLRITVTKEILERSKMCGSNDKNLEQLTTHCAIALAIRDIWPKANVESAGIYLDSESYNRWPEAADILLPPVAQEFITDFDMAEPEDRVKLDPVSFEVEIPDSIIENINIDELKPLLENHPTLALV